MRLFKIAAVIALMAGSIGLSTTADAQRYDGRHRVERSDHHRDYRRDRDRRDDRRYRNIRRDDRRYGRTSRHEVRRYNSYRKARHCRMEWRHKRRIRVCR